MRITKRRAVVAAATTSVVVLGVTAAYAYWTSSGTGSGTAAAGTSTTVTVLQTNATITGLSPGGTAVALSGAFDNSASGSTPVKVGPVTATSVTVDSGHSACVPGNMTTGNIVMGGSDPGAPHTLATGTPVDAWSGLTIRLAETGANQDPCKGATFTINYAVSAAA
jgi:hypothetical protein